MLLPPQLANDARRLYHVLRTIDDLVDENDPRAAQRVEATEAWAHGQHAQTPETITIDKLASSYPLCRQALIDFCAGMRHDLDGQTIQTDHDLETYCHQVGGTVGIMLTALLGTTHPEGKQRMATLGRAMQHTNILRDIDEDHANGRLYIPQSTIDRYGYPTPGAREQLLRSHIAHADKLYEEGMRAIPLLRDGQSAMGLSAILYREILRQIERDGFGRNPGRPTVPTWRKHQLITKHARTSRSPSRSRSRAAP